MLSNLALIAEIIGAIAVIITLLFVGYEIRGNTRAIKANATATTFFDWADFNSEFAHSPELFIFARTLDRKIDIDDFTEEELITMDTLGRSIIQRFNGMFVQYQSGLIEEEIWKQYESWCYSLIVLPFWARWWEGDKGQPVYTQDFKDTIQSGIDANLKLGVAR